MLPPTIPIPSGVVVGRVGGIGFSDGGGIGGGAVEARIKEGIEALDGCFDNVGDGGGVPAPVGVGGRRRRGGGGALAAAEGGIGKGNPRRREGPAERGGRENGVGECELVRGRSGDGSHGWNC